MHREKKNVKMQTAEWIINHMSKKDDEKKAKFHKCGNKWKSTED